MGLFLNDASKSQERIKQSNYLIQIKMTASSGSLSSAIVKCHYSFLH